MKPKAKLKIAVDLLMTAGLLFLMGYQFWGDLAHEWAGAGMFLLFLLHHVLNGHWHQAIFRGRYTPVRVLHLVIDLAVFLAMAGLMVSGVILSSYVFASLPIRGRMGFARLLHMVSVYWGFVGMALHLGLHWGMFQGMGRKALKLRPSRVRQVLLPVLGAFMDSSPLCGGVSSLICWCGPTSCFSISANPFLGSIWTTWPSWVHAFFWPITPRSFCGGGPKEQTSSKNKNIVITFRRNQL